MKSIILPTRPYQLFFEHRPGYLYAYVHSNTISFSIAKGYWIEILSMLHRRRYKRILVDKNVPQKLPAHDVFELTSELAHSGYSDVFFAVYDHYYEAEKCEFEEMVGTNRGLHVRISESFTDLEKWLLSQTVEQKIDKNHFPHGRGTPRALSARIRQ